LTTDTYYETLKEERLIKAYVVIGKDLVDKVFGEISQDSGDKYKAISFLNEISQLALAGVELDYDYIIKFWKLYKDTLRCCGESLSMAIKAFSHGLTESTDSFRRLGEVQKALYKELKWHQRLWLWLQDKFDSLLEFVIRILKRCGKNSNKFSLLY